MTTSHSFAQMLVDEPTEVITPLNQGEGSLELDTPDQAETIQPLTPIMDSIDGFRSIDWANVRRQCRAGINRIYINYDKRVYLGAGCRVELGNFTGLKYDDPELQFPVNSIFCTQERCV